MRFVSYGLFLAGVVLLVEYSRSHAGDAKAEAGFTSLFNGKDLTGWKTKKGDSLEGKTETPDKRFKVVDGLLHIDPKAKGDVYIYTTKEFGGDVHLKMEFLIGPGCNNDNFFRGIKFDIVPKALKGVKEGEWNLFEIIVKGDKAEYKINGVTQRVAAAKPAATSFGLRAEFGEIKYKNIQIKAGK